VPQRRYNKGAGRENAENQDVVIFIQDNGSYLRVTKALRGDYTGLIGRDQEVLPGAGYTISVRFEVNKPIILSNILISSIAQWPGYPPKVYQVSWLIWCPRKWLRPEIPDPGPRLV
jgi:hypothetical protein